MKRRNDSSRLLADLQSSDENVRAQAAVGLHRLGHAHAPEACLGTLNDAPDALHADRTPSVQCLIEIGEPVLPPLVDLLGSKDRDTRMHAERAIQGITRRLFGFDGFTWPEGAMDRWMNWWSDIGFDLDDAPSQRTKAIERLEVGLKSLLAHDA